MFSTKTGVAALSVASNAVLTLGKLTIGLYIGSVSVVAEGIHSSVDLLASLIAYFSVRVSSRPPDEKYPYGRGKIENISGTVEAVLIFLAAGMIIYEAISKIIHGTEPPEVDLGLVIMGFSIVANVLVSRQLLKVARETDSVALEADAYHLTTDVLTSAGVLVGLIAVRLTGFAFLDPVAALLVAALIIKAAWDITRKSFVDLLDQSLPDAERAVIEEVLRQHSNRLVGFHQVRTRKAGGDRHVDLHLVVNASSPVSEAHALCDHLERDLGKMLRNCTFSIHIEPCRRECASCTVQCSSRPIAS